ncbi:MAG TPA: hypothetical protein PK360_15265, partial [bacterium]|nr:hypothetical protein [bacterium]
PGIPDHADRFVDGTRRLRTDLPAALTRAVEKAIRWLPLLIFPLKKKKMKFLIPEPDLTSSGWKVWNFHTQDPFFLIRRKGR